MCSASRGTWQIEGDLVRCREIQARYRGDIGEMPQCRLRLALRLLVLARRALVRVRGRVRGWLGLGLGVG